MKVFISWSGALSRAVGVLFAQWLPEVIQECSDPFISTDLTKGEPWFQTITTNLKDNELGVVLITKSNMESSWLNFEAGALLNKFDKSGVRPLLVDLKKEDYKGPMSSLQLTELNEQADVLLLMKSLNEMCARPLQEKVLEKAFKNSWDEFRDGVEAIVAKIDTSRTKPPVRSQIDKIDEILTLVRGISGSEHSPYNLSNAISRDAIAHLPELGVRTLSYFKNKYGSLTAAHLKDRVLGDVINFEENEQGELLFVVVKLGTGRTTLWRQGSFEIRPF